MVEDDSSIRLIAHYAGSSALRSAKVGRLPRSQRSHEDQLPLIGIYSCLLCERRFSTKLRLNRHYRETHGENIQDYKGKSGVLVIWHISHLVRKPRDFQDTYKGKDQTD